MTDFAKFLQLYNSLGIDPEMYKLGRYLIMNLTVGDSNNKIIGYGGHCTEIYFDFAGKFVKQSVCENEKYED